MPERAGTSAPLQSDRVRNLLGKFVEHASRAAKSGYSNTDRDGYVVAARDVRQRDLIIIQSGDFEPVQYVIDTNVGDDQPEAMLTIQSGGYGVEFGIGQFDRRY